MIPSSEILKQVRKQNEARKLWREHDSLPSLGEAIFEEGLELAEAVGLAEIGGGAFEVASEVGDVLYLYAKYTHYAKIANVAIPDVVAQTVEYAMDVCNRTGINVDDVIKLKLFRNSFKYNDYATNNGYDYEEGTRLCRDFWKTMGGDEAFSRAYEIYGEEL